MDERNINPIIRDEVKSKQQVNLSTIASIIYFLTMEYLERLCPEAKGYSLDLVHYNGFRDVIYR